jgi:hypothetical protein
MEFLVALCKKNMKLLLQFFGYIDQSIFTSGLYLVNITEARIFSENTILS